jgi:MFS family permease
MERIGTGRTAALGVLLVLVFSAPLALLRGDTSYVAITVVLLLQGFGIGVALMPAVTAAYRALRPDQINDASPQTNIVQRVGSSIGTAVLIGVLQHGLSDAGRSVNGQVRAFDSTFVWLAAITGVAFAAALLLVFLERRAALIPPDDPDAIQEAELQALTVPEPG